MKFNAANALSFSRIAIGGAIAVLPGSKAPDMAVARQVTSLYLAGLGTDLVDGALARRSGAEPNDKLDALCDATLLLGLMTASNRLYPSRSRFAATSALVPAYVASVLVKQRFVPSSAIIDRTHFFGSITLASVLLAELGVTAGLSPRQVAIIEATVLAALAALKRGRLIAAIRG